MIGAFFVKRTGSLSFVEDVNNGVGISYSAEVISGNVRHGIELDYLRVRKELTVGTSSSGPYIKTAGAATDINSYSTKIDPTKVQLTVGSTLADWRATGDLTKIDGGKLYTGSVITSALAFTPLISSGGTGAIVATINASAEGIRISGARITIDGNVQFTSGYDPTTKIASGGAAADVNANVTTISGGKITANSITADRLNVSTLSAITANLGTVTAGTLTSVLMRTAASGARFEFYSAAGIGPDGARLSAYNSSGEEIGCLYAHASDIIYLSAIKSTASIGMITAAGKYLRGDDSYGGFECSGNFFSFSSLSAGNTRSAPYFNVDASGQITKVNNITASGNTGKILRSNGASFTPASLTAADVGLGNVENTALSTWAGTPNITTLGTIADVLNLGKGLKFNNAQDYTVTSTDNSNGYFTMTSGKNYLRLTPQADGYSVGIYGMTDRSLIMISNLHGSYSISVEGKTLAPGKSALFMYEAANSIVRVIG